LQPHKRIDFSLVFAGRAVGIKEAHDDIWRSSNGHRPLNCRSLDRYFYHRSGCGPHVQGEVEDLLCPNREGNPFAGLGL